MSLCGKLIFSVITFPIIILMAILQSYVFTPLIIIVNAFGNLFPKCQEMTFVKRLSKSCNRVKFWEALSESSFQCLLAMYFYYNNKDSFNCQNTYISWFNDGTFLIISIIFSIISITLALINNGNEKLTVRYGKDWWKALLLKRPELIREWKFLSKVLIFISTLTILIGAFIFITF